MAVAGFPSVGRSNLTDTTNGLSLSWLVPLTVARAKLASTARNILLILSSPTGSDYRVVTQSVNYLNGSGLTQEIFENAG